MKKMLMLLFVILFLSILSSCEKECPVCQQPDIRYMYNYENEFIAKKFQYSAKERMPELDEICKSLYEGNLIDTNQIMSTVKEKYNQTGEIIILKLHAKPFDYAFNEDYLWRRYLTDYLNPLTAWQKYKKIAYGYCDYSDKIGLVTGIDSAVFAFTYLD